MTKDIKAIEKELVEGTMTRNELIEEFKDTLEKAKTVYKTETEESIKGTKLYDNLTKRYEDYLNTNDKTTRIMFDTLPSTVTGIFKQREFNCSKRIGCLNFADSITPGGLVWQGEKTQEECLCRSSNLYLTLLGDMNKYGYYHYNEQFKGKGSNRIIYSPDVLFYKDDMLRKKKPVKCDVITSPAPLSHYSTHDLVVERMTDILLVAKEKKIDTLILGNWGCGAFGNDKVLFAKYWKEALSKVHLNTVVFVTTDGYGDIKDVLC